MLRTKKWQKKNNLKTGFALFCPIILQRKKVVMILMKAAGQCSSPPSCKTIMHTNAIPSNLHCLVFTRHCHNGPAAVHSSNQNHHFTNSKKNRFVLCLLLRRTFSKTNSGISWRHSKANCSANGKHFSL